MARLRDHDEDERLDKLMDDMARLMDEFARKRAEAMRVTQELARKKPPVRVGMRAASSSTRRTA